MLKTQYQKIKKIINKLEDEALNEGVDITSSEFELLISDFLKQKGFTSEEYLEHDDPKPQEDKPEEIDLKII